MTPIAALMFGFAVLLLLFGGFVYLGNGEIIKGYRFAKIKNKKEYDRYLGKSIAMCALAPFLSGIGSIFLGNFAAISIFIAVLIVLLVNISKNAKDLYD